MIPQPLPSPNEPNPKALARLFDYFLELVEQGIIVPKVKPVIAGEEAAPVELVELEAV